MPREDVRLDGHSDVLRLGKRKRPGGRLGETIRREVIKRDGLTCRYCGGECFLVVFGLRRRRQDSDLTFDHVVPRSRGGRSTMENVVVACLRCNIFKGDKLLSEIGMVLLPEPAR